MRSTHKINFFLKSKTHKTPLTHLLFEPRRFRSCKRVAEALISGHGVARACVAMSASSAARAEPALCPALCACSVWDLAEALLCSSASVPNPEFIAKCAAQHQIVIDLFHGNARSLKRAAAKLPACWLAQPSRVLRGGHSGRGTQRSAQRSPPGSRLLCTNSLKHLHFLCSFS